MSAHTPSLMWFRDDLRVADNPALSAAMAAGPTMALYILDERSAGIRPLGGAAKWWLHHGLEDLRGNLRRLGVELVLRRGAAQDILPGIVRASGATAVHWNRRYGGPERAVDSGLKETLGIAGHPVHSHGASLLHEPWVPVTQDGRPFKVFTPFFNALQRLAQRPAFAEPDPQSPVTGNHLQSESLTSWALLPSAPDWSRGLASVWEPGEQAAHQRLSLVLDEVAQGYGTTRDRPDYDGTSRLSPALRWGHLSPVQVWESLGSRLSSHPEAAEGSRALMRQLAWRDFCWNLLYHQPDLATRNLRAEFDGFDWAWPVAGEPNGPVQEQCLAQWAAWRRGDTGYRMVDAGMKQLWDTGWMHNRVRMVTASFLVKNLGIHWRMGEEWFWDTLVDADAASNPTNWQWVAGCGADASPFFRVFNPELQAKKFDPQGNYVGRFAPLPSPVPLVDLKESRAAALDAYVAMKNS